MEFTSNEYFDVNVTYIDNPISFYLTRVGKGFSVSLLISTNLGCFVKFFCEHMCVHVCVCVCRMSWKP